MTRESTESPHGRSIDRRAFLSGATGSILALAGCASGGTDSGTDSSGTAVSQSTTFEDISVNGGDLEVALAADVSASWVHRYGPDGEMAEKAMVPPSGEAARFDLVGSADEEVYTPGEQTIRAIEDGESVAETTIEIRPDVTLTDFRWAKNYPEMDIWEKNGNDWDEHVALTFANSGSGPAQLSRTRWKNAPFTFQFERSVDEYEHGTVLPPGETTTIQSEATVFHVTGRFYEGTAVECGTLDTEEFTLTAIIEPGPNETFSQTVKYGGGRGSDCNLSIVEGEN